MPFNSPLNFLLLYADISLGNGGGAVLQELLDEGDIVYVPVVETQQTKTMFPGMGGMPGGMPGGMGGEMSGGMPGGNMGGNRMSGGMSGGMPGGGMR